MNHVHPAEAEDPASSDRGFGFVTLQAPSAYVSAGACVSSFVAQERQGLFCDDLSLIRSYEVIEEVLQEHMWVTLPASPPLSLSVFGVLLCKV